MFYSHAKHCGNVLFLPVSIIYPDFILIVFNEHNRIPFCGLVVTRRSRFRIEDKLCIRHSDGHDSAFLLTVQVGVFFIRREGFLSITVWLTLQSQTAVPGTSTFLFSCLRNNNPIQSEPESTATRWASQKCACSFWNWNGLKLKPESNVMFSSALIRVHFRQRAGWHSGRSSGHSCTLVVEYFRVTAYPKVLHSSYTTAIWQRWPFSKWDHSTQYIF